MHPKNLLNQRGLRPSKRLGQNFLIDKGAIRKIIEAAGLQPNDIVLEIGPGLGVLTRELAKIVKKVVAVEKDPQMIKILGETLKEFKNIEVIHGDIRYLISETKKSNYKFVGNLPFYLTAPVIRQFLEHTDSRCLYAVFTVQKEVAQRICAKPPDMNLLAVSVQFYAEPKIISYIPKKSFWPSPKVDAAILKITPRVSENYAIAQKATKSPPAPPVLFFKVAKAGFSQPRKQLANNLSAGLKIDKNKIREWLLENSVKPVQRAETLTIGDWIKLVKSYPDEL